MSPIPLFQPSPQEHVDGRIVDWNLPSQVQLQVSPDAGFTNVIFPETTFRLTIDNSIGDGSVPVCGGEAWVLLADEHGREATFGRYDFLEDVDCHAFTDTPMDPGEHTWTFRSPDDSSRIVGQYDPGDADPRSGITSGGTVYLQVFNTGNWGSREDLLFSQPFQLTGGLPTLGEVRVTEVDVQVDGGGDTVTATSTIVNPIKRGVDVGLELTVTSHQTGNVVYTDTVSTSATGVLDWGTINRTDVDWTIPADQLPPGGLDVCVEVVSRT